METLFIGKNAIFLPHTDSTNSYATHLLKNVNLHEGTVVHALHQTAGRGLSGNSWNAEAASNLTVSIILRPGFLSTKKAFYLYQLTALSCYDTLSELLGPGQFDIKIKWPNDILVNRRKVAGILIENNITNDHFNWSVLGVGMNINQEHFRDLPGATSVKQLTGQNYDVKQIMARLCAHLEKHYLFLKHNQAGRITQAYLERLYGLGELLDFEIDGVRKRLMVKGVSERGFLMLEGQGGKPFEMDVKEFKWIL